MTRYLSLRHKATGATALGRKVTNGLVLVQFDRAAHPQAYGWHLYPRRAFQRIRPKRTPR